ncbi:MAG: DUF4255 domain-containing protein [Chloroflexi bacterium]|nr:DUF4255 domain-containing protein [Chloroflexota bacterium]MBV9896828.1 DUF4255 domain-containing protein [Chloroflexota bacterium]
MLDDLDETVRELLHRYVPVDPEHVDVSFDLPDREWSARLTRPTINCFLYDLRENHKMRNSSWETHRQVGANSASRQKGPLRFDAMYQITTWARSNDDQHRLLWRTVAALARHTVLSPDLLVGELKDQPLPVSTTVAQPDQGLANVGDFWNAIDNRARPVLTYVVTLSLDPEIVVGSKLVLGQPTIKLQQLGREEVLNGFSITGRVKDRSDTTRIVDGALVVMSETGDRVLTDDEGAFAFRGVRRGPVTLVICAPHREQTTWSFRVPASKYDVEV